MMTARLFCGLGWRSGDERAGAGDALAHDVAAEDFHEIEEARAGGFAGHGDAGDLDDGAELGESEFFLEGAEFGFDFVFGRVTGEGFEPLIEGIEEGPDVGFAECLFDGFGIEGGFFEEEEGAGGAKPARVLTRSCSRVRAASRRVGSASRSRGRVAAVWAASARWHRPARGYRCGRPSRGGWWGCWRRRRWRG